MKAQIVPAPERGPGRAWLVVEAPLPPGAGIAIMNEADTNRHLGPNGWQPTPAELQLAGIEASGSGTRALLGPAIVDRIRDSEFIVIHLGETEIFAGFWPTIAPSGEQSSGRQILGRAPEPEPAVSEPIAAETAAASPAEHASQTQPSRGRRSHAIWLAAGTAACLLLVAGALVFLRPEWLFGTPSTPQTAAAASDLDLGPDEWRRLISDRNTDVTRLYELGRLLRESPDGDADIGFEALYAAGQRGSVPALLWYGQANDPTRADTAGDIEAPNVRRALEAYGAAAAQGEESAATALAGLCEHLRERRFSGTPEERTSFADHCP